MATSRRYEGPLRSDMILTAPDNAGEPGFRRVRLLARHPDGGWIVEDVPSRLYPSGSWMIRSPEENLRIVFEPEEGQL